MKVSIVATIAVVCLISVGTPTEGRPEDPMEQVACDISIRLNTRLLNWKYYPAFLCTAFEEVDEICGSDLVNLCLTKKGITTTSAPEPEDKPEEEPEAE